MTEQTIDWTEYVRKVELTIDLLSKQNAALSAERDDLAAKLAAALAEIITIQARAEVVCNDYAVKLESAQSELHDLRIKQGLQP